MSKKQVKKWTMRTGEKIRICDMEDVHLLNTIKLLEREHQEELSAAWVELGRLQGELAIEDCERSIKRAEDVKSFHPLYKHLFLEACQRKLLS